MKACWFVFLLIFIAFEADAQFLKKKPNQFGSDGLKTGQWITYWDDAQEVPMSVATYKHGREKGVSKEYHQNGKLRMKFRHHQNRIRVKYYSNNRKLEQKGWARLEYSDADIRFYWHGNWKFYNQPRKLTRVASYQYGQEVPIVL